MIFNERAIPPAFVVDAIPGAPELREAVVSARAALTAAGQALRNVGGQLQAKAFGPLGDMTPRTGVSQAQLDEAIDTHRHATEAADAADRAHSAALRRLHSKVREGVRAEAFKDAHATLADQAHNKAVEAASALRQALTDRDDFDAAIGRRRDPSAAAPYDRRYYLEGVDNLTNARIMSDRARAIDELESSTMTAEERSAFAKRNGLIAG